MKRARVIVVVISSLVMSGGVVTAGVAGVEIIQMKSNLGAEYLPKLDLSESKPVSTTLPKLRVGDVVGSIAIPRIRKIIPIIEGTGSDQLKRGVGHYLGSVLPGITDNSVLAGHRDSVFRDLGKLKRGDLLKVKTSYGLFTYEVHKIRIVMANDRTVIVPSDLPILTLSTCYPFRYIGNAPQRYIVQAGLVIGEPIA
jgi:sortase A